MTGDNIKLASRILPPLIILDPGNFTPLYDINLAMALAERGWRPSWVTSLHQFDEISVPASLPVRTSFFSLFRIPSLRFLQSAPALRRVAKVLCYPVDLAALSSSLSRAEPGIIHVQWALLPPLDILFWRKLKAHGWVVVYTLHDPDLLSGSMPRLLNCLGPQLCSIANAVIVHSKVGARVLEQAGILPHQIRILPPGPPVNGSQSYRETARAILGVPSTIPVVLFFGYIKPYKGLHVLLESLLHLRRTLGDVLLIVAGECMEPRQRYSNLISQLGLEREVRWFDGYVPDRAMCLYFAAADVVALPYVAASSSGVLLSAYAFERPVVATAVGGNPELVEDGSTGLLVPPGNPIALAGALAFILRNPHIASVMGARGSDMVKEFYSWRSIARQTEELYLLLQRGKD